MLRVLLLALIVLAPPALGQTTNQNFPCQVGWSWTFVDESGGTHNREIVGRSAVLGRDVFVMRHHAIGADEFYSVDTSGDVRWHGFAGPSGETYLDPPLVVLRAGAQPGATWTSLCQTYCDAEGTIPSGPVREYQFSVVATEHISVPAGHFSALHVTGVPVIGCASVSAIPVLGELVPQQSSLLLPSTDIEVHYWYVDNVGLAQVDIPAYVGALLTLQSWGEPLVASEKRTWGSVKAWFR